MADCPRAARHGVGVEHCGRPSIVISLYRSRVATTVIELAKDDPPLVKEMIAQLRAAGEIEADDLIYLDRIADRWIAIAAGNRQRARPAYLR
jgi:hypothetical protein